MDDDDNTVRVGDVACRIVYSTLEEIQCLTQAGTDLSTLSSAPAADVGATPAYSTVLSATAAEGAAATEAMRPSADGAYLADEGAQKGYGCTPLPPAIPGPEPLSRGPSSIDPL